MTFSSFGNWRFADGNQAGQPVSGLFYYGSGFPLQEGQIMFCQPLGGSKYSSHLKEFACLGGVKKARGFYPRDIKDHEFLKMVLTKTISQMWVLYMRP